MYGIVFLRRTFLGCLVAFLLFPMSVHAAEPLRIGVEDKDWPGHYVWVNGALEGVDADIVRIVAEKIGVQVVFEPYPWKRVLLMANAGFVDAVMNLAPTIKRKEYLHFVETPLSRESTVFWVKKGSSFAFNGVFEPTLRLGLMRGADWSDRFQKQGTPIVVRFNTYQVAFRNLVEGRIDCFGSHLTPTHEYAARLGFLDKVEPSYPMLEDLTYFIAFTFKPGHDQLAVRFNKALAKFFDSEEYLNLVRKHGSIRIPRPSDLGNNEAE